MREAPPINPSLHGVMMDHGAASRWTKTTYG